MNDTTTDATRGSASAPVSAAAGQPENVGVIVIHGVGQAEVGWINDYIVDELAKREPAMGLDPYSLVYRLLDKGRTKPGAMFRTVVRRARIADRVNVSFAELHWADLSRVGQGAFLRMITVLRLFLEAPQVLGTSFLNQSSVGVHGWIRWLILAALWILRWPVAGTTLSLFVSAFGLVVLQKYVVTIEGTALPYVVMGLLAATAAVGYAFARFRVNHDIALTDLGLSMAIFAGLMFLVVAIATATVPTDATRHVMGDPAVYLAFAGNFIIYLWIPWNMAAVGAIVLMVLVGLKRVAFGAGRGRQVPLLRPANAVGLAIIQGTIWKLLICPVSLAIIYLLVDEKSVKGTCVDPPLFLWAPDTIEWAHATVRIIAVKMVLVSTLNLGMTLLAILAVLGVVTARSRSLSNRSRRLLGGEDSLPRMIVHPAITLALCAGLCLNVSIYYWFFKKDLDICWLHAWLDHGGAVNALDAQSLSEGCALLGTSCLQQLRGITTSSTVLTILFYFLGVVQKASSGVVHVARDIVGHQFTPRFEMARGLLPGVRPRGTYPRRERIQKRLDALVESIVTTQPIDRLVFVTHSQGTVIMHDYLRSVRDDRYLAHIKRIDVVTLASPLTHIYQHYFRAYEVQSGTAAALNPKLASWTNLWRIDDPIGSRVDIVLDNFICNEPLPKGGHVNYWREERVCEVVLDVIDPTPARMAATVIAAPLAKPSLKA